MPINKTDPSLRFLHLDHCPRLVHVLPFFRLNKHTSCALIQEILEIVYCSDLKEVFPLDREFHAKDEIIEFPKLRFIHLHELPMLQRICGRRMYAPNLESGAAGASGVCRQSGATPSCPRWTARRNGGTTWSGMGCGRTTTTLPSTS